MSQFAVSRPALVRPGRLLGLLAAVVCLVAGGLAAPAQAGTGEITVYSYTMKGYANHMSHTITVGHRFRFSITMYGCRDGGGDGNLIVWDPKKQPKSSGHTGVIKALWDPHLRGDHTWSKYIPTKHHVRWWNDGGDLVDCHYTVKIVEYLSPGGPQ